MNSLTTKLWSVVFVALLLGVPAWNALAQDTETAEGGYKIGVVDRKKVFDNYQKQIDKYAQLEKERETRQAEIDALGDKLEAERKALVEKQDSMTEEQKVQAQSEFEQKMKDYRRKLDDLQSEIDKMATAHFKDMVDEISQGIAEVANDENYHLVLEASSDPKIPSSVLYYSKTIDITEKVLTHLNEQYKASK